MDYEQLWKSLFKSLNCAVPIWSSTNDPQPYTLYSLAEGEVPSLATLRLHSPCTKRPPSLETFDDRVLYTDVFEVRGHRIYCAHTKVALTVVFCLWEQNPTDGILAQLPDAIFDTLNDSICSFNPIAYDLVFKVDCRSVRKVDCLFDESGITYSDDHFQLTDCKLWPMVESIFSSMCVEMDGANAIASDRESGHFYYKGEYIRLKAMWCERVEKAIESGLPFSESWLIAIWLYVSGCPPHISDENSLMQDISDIVQKFSMDDIPSQDLVRAMEVAGYRRPFARMVAMFLSLSSSFEFTEIIRGIATPLSLNSFLCCVDENANQYAFYRSSLKGEGEDEFTASKASQCFISVAGDTLSVKPLIAQPFSPFNEWKEKDFARHTYMTIVSMLNGNPDHYVLGHVTSEQSVIEMCIREGEVAEETRMRGMSVLAGHRNSSSCGHGMYFFQISQVGDFDTFCTLENVPEHAVKYYEFQSFLYALTRAFDNPTRNYQLAPAVLLFMVPNDQTFMNAYSQNLPLLDDEFDGCSCKRRYNKPSSEGPHSEFTID